MKDNSPKIRIYQTEYPTCFGWYKTHKELQYLDPTEGWTKVPVEYNYLNGFKF